MDFIVPPVRQQGVFAWLKEVYESDIFEVSPKNEPKVLTFGSS
jgi:hypothetical protein